MTDSTSPGLRGRLTRLALPSLGTIFLALTTLPTLLRLPAKVLAVTPDGVYAAEFVYAGAALTFAAAFVLVKYLPRPKSTQDRRTP